ncbi:MAG TPA: peptidoglycan recognition family protein [Micromonosporaceae bacterium]|nr:peptidoglycan recognition family protein [Micromonosporaceae bacterium]
MVSRRLVLAGATGLVAGAFPLTRALADDGSSGAIPQTLALPRPRLADGAYPAAADFAVTHLGVSWQGASAGLRLRTRAGWGEWRTLGGCPAGRDDRLAAAAKGALLVAPGVVGYELAGGAASVVELNTVDGPTRARAAAPAGRLPIGRRGHARVRYLSRRAWGADESLRFSATGTENWVPAYYPVQTVTVHHTAGINDDPDPAATIRGIYYDQAVAQGWGDVGYHLFIDEAGQVYEGRVSGDDALPVLGGPVTADGRPQAVNGAHVVTYNAGNVGVCLLGHFNERQPTAAARRSLTLVLAALAKACQLDPLGVTNYVNPVNGKARTVNTISGHRDWAATDCPGHAFYPELPGLRQDVADLIR